MSATELSAQPFAGRHDESLYAVTVVRGVRIPTEAGFELSADLFLPVGAGPVPAVITVEPYRCDAGGGLQYAAGLSWFAARGYAALLVDFLGTGSSDGTQRAPFAADESDDGVDAVEWAAGQPWCDGNVGMWGKSYGAILAMRTATKHPPHLKAIAPMMGMLDPERDFVHPADIRGNLGSVVRWGAETLLGHFLPPLRTYDTGADRRRWLTRARDVEPWVIDIFEHGPGDPIWRSRTIDAHQITIPALCIAGWRDLFCEATIRAYDEINAPKKLIVGPWMHLLPEVSPFEPADVRNEIARWWSRWLRDSPPPEETAGLDHAVVYIQGGAPEWRTFDTWPPRGDVQQWAMSPETTLVPEATTGDEPPAVPTEAIAEYVTDPTVGALSGLWGVPTSGFGYPLDQHDDDMRSLHGTSGALAADVIIAGVATAGIELAPGSTVDRVVVKLTDVDPDGRSILITSGTTALSPGAGHAQITMSPTCYRVPAGHRIRVAISDSDFGQLWPASADGDTPRRLVMRAMNLTLPDVPEHEGHPFVPPPVETQNSGASVVSHPQWQVTRDHIHDGVTVRLREQVTTPTATGQHLLRTRQEMTTSVTRAAPASARASADTTVTVQTDEGETVRVRLQLLLTGNSLRATGQVALDGHIVVERSWEV